MEICISTSFYAFCYNQHYEWMQIYAALSFCWSKEFVFRKSKLNRYSSVPSLYSSMSFSSTFPSSQDVQSLDLIVSLLIVLPPYGVKTSFTYNFIQFYQLLCSRLFTTPNGRNTYMLSSPTVWHSADGIQTHYLQCILEIFSKVAP